jgi:hypothetical protein
VIAYEEDLNQNVEFYAVASKRNLSLKQYAKESVDGIYIYNKNGKYRDIIERCLKDGTCMQTTVKFEISNRVNANRASVKFITKSNIKRSLKKYFHKKGISTKAASKKIVFKITKESKYSKFLAQRVVSFHVQATLYKKSKLIKSINETCDEDGLNDSLYEIYLELEDL